MDPKKLFDAIPLTTDPKVGDFIAAANWSRPRLVLAVDKNQDGTIVSVAEPDSSRADEHGVRRMEAEEFASRTWRYYPYLTQLWALQG